MVDLAEQPVAVIKGKVPFDELPQFYDTAFGTAARSTHHGSFDGLGEAWGRLGAFIGEQGRAPGPVMWECYLTEPSPDMDPADLRTELTWPLAD
ncbi:MAG: hypothetical protein JJU45_11380 [Acidimicrobiia bacterium]|nr:hypothetical protein [Acidimicrobiia bacterium]